MAQGRSDRLSLDHRLGARMGWFAAAEVALPLSLSLAGSALAEPLVQPQLQHARCPHGFHRFGDRCLSTPGSCCVRYR